jgi:hypothetical protein
MSDLIDDDTLMPVMPYERFIANFVKFYTYYETYQDIYIHMQMEGWTFDDPSAGDTGSYGNCVEWSTYVDDDGNTQNLFEQNGGDGYFAYIGYLIGAEPDRIWNFMYDGGPPARTWEWWASGLLIWFLTGPNEFKLQVALMQRTQAKMHQLLGAMTCRNILCLDNRGRPVLE